MYNITRSALEKVGDFVIFNINILLNCRRVYLAETIKQMISIGYLSIPVVAFTATFVGAILAIQSYMGFEVMQSQMMVANILTTSITREIGPVVVGIIVAGRVASTIAAEIGAMQVTEQVDLLRSLSIDVHAYLVAPKVIAALISFPILAVISDVYGILGGYLIGIYKFHFNHMLYISDTVASLSYGDFMSGIVKSLFFGFLTTSVSCFNGLRSTGGARGVGFAVTNSVVVSFVLILFMNYLITLFMFYGK
ncbi:hypothetical protein NHE_0661 [Neorickettsia helminthoeca str. Oregon]|uniref:Permease family protein n=1 Tax=Neorickettsia helminthoeca str. Oregon TaxID=1286528 RepID=X5HKL5_9RICK|nr:ABC transporter permease [Neorickettsia helminthoeca]AHX11594.1 hypothetical protein NHE_0661 [Neorickettsia helminthoeca str. Oregon]